MNKKVIHSVFEATVKKHPSNIAIEAGSKRLSYDELNRQANQLASLLMARGVNKGAITCVLLEEEWTQVIALLGVFKAGLIYLPLDKKYKESHWAELYATMQPTVLLTNRENKALIEKYDTIFDYSIPEIIVVDEGENNGLAFEVLKYNSGQYQAVTSTETYSDDNPDTELSGEDSNYIFFTSGSSGKPKAVLGQHKSLSHFIHWETKELNIGEGDRIGQLTSFSFDASLRDIFVPLIKGGTICIPPKAIKEDTLLLSDWISEQKITLLHTIPTRFRMLTHVGAGKNDLKKFDKLRYILLAGEKLYNKDIYHWRAHYGTSTTLINLYGATESTLVKSFYRVPEELSGAASEVLCVGKPISNTAFIILNKDQQLCRINEVGEIYIKTPFLSKGYYKDERLTKEKFVQNPLNSETDIIYKSNDYGKYDAERNVIVLGRKDSVTKINGVRVDVNSIEQTILGFKKIQAVKCLVHHRSELDVVLVCFYTATSDVEEDLKAYCLKYLSAYELPAFYIHLDAFPVNVNGKTDVAALKGKLLEQVDERLTFQAPVNDIEAKLVMIWKETLELEKVSTNDNFFSLGGQSLKMMLLFNKISKHFGHTLSLEEFYQHLTIEKLATFLAAKTTPTFDEIKPLPENDEGYALSNEQLRIWVTCQSAQQSVAHNMSYTYTIYGAFDRDLFCQAWQKLIKRHEALRTSFSVNASGEVVQKVKEDSSFDLIFSYVNASNNELSEEGTEKYLRTFSSQVFHLDEAPLFRVSLIEVNEKEFILSTLMHHIIGDHHSVEILIKELIEIYSGLQKNRPVHLIRLKSHYKDYVQWVKQKLADGSFASKKSYWNMQLNSVCRQAKWYDVSTDVVDYTGAHFSDSFSEKLAGRIKAYCKATNRTPMNLVAAALSILIHKISGYHEVLIGIPVNLRTHPDLAGQVGLFLNLLPLKVQLSADQNVKSLLDEVALTQMKTLDHAFYPFDLIVDEFEQSKHFNLIDRLDIYLNYINHTESIDAGLEHLKVVARERAIKMSKFPICFYVNNYESKMTFTIEYQTAIFDSKEITKLADRFCRCLELLLDNGEKEIRSLSLIDKKTIPVFSFK